MKPTKEQIEKAREIWVNRGIYADTIKFDNSYKYYHSDHVAALEARVAELRRTIERLEADRKLAMAEKELRVILPMAKAHAFRHDVGNNVQMCKDATNTLSAISAKDGEK